MKLLTVVVLVVMVSACEIALKIEDTEKLNALMDGGITVRIEGIPDGGIPVSFVPVALPLQEDDGGK